MLSLCMCVLSLSCYSRTFSIIPHPTPHLLQGLHGDMVLVAGVNTGTTKVRLIQLSAIPGTSGFITRACMTTGEYPKATT